MRKLSGIALLTLFAAPALASAQRLGVAGHAGTLGLGADVALQLHERVGVRVGGNFFPIEPEFEVDGINYVFTLPSPQFTAMVDLHLTGALRISGGFLQSKNDLEIAGEFADSIDIGPRRYAPSEIGNLTGVVDTEDLSPYLGLGIGNPAGSSFGFFLDLGVAFHGEPTLTLVADGPITALGSFQSDLAAEQANAQDTLSDISVYPVVSIGFSIGFGK